MAQKNKKQKVKVDRQKIWYDAAELAEYGGIIIKGILFFLVARWFVISKKDSAFALTVLVGMLLFKNIWRVYKKHRENKKENG